MVLQLYGKIGEKGQVVVPKPIRKQLNLSAGSEVVFEVEEKRVILKTADVLKTYEEFISLPKKKLPKHIDWDKEYSSQFSS